MAYQNKYEQIYNALTANFGDAGHLPGVTEIIDVIIKANVRSGVFKLEPDCFDDTERRALQILEPICLGATAVSILDSSSESLHGEALQRRVLDYYTSAVNAINSGEVNLSELKPRQ